MSASQKAVQIAKMVRGSFAMTGQQIEDWGLDLWVDDLMPYPLEAIAQALKEGARMSRMPSLRSVCDRLEGRVDAKDEAQDVADLIVKSIAGIGSYRASDARKAIGEVGWEVVTRFGGWETLCKVTEKELPTVRAQLRDSARAVFAKARAGSLNTAPTLPSPATETARLGPASAAIETVLPRRPTK